jgi:hypothetical protein
MDYGRNMSSNRLIDILDDEKKVAGLNEDYHYRQSIVPRLEKLDKNMKKAKGNYDIDDIEIRYLESLLETLSENPSHRLTADNMKKCNQLWRKYK